MNVFSWLLGLLDWVVSGPAPAAAAPPALVPGPTSTPASPVPELDPGAVLAALLIGHNRLRSKVGVRDLALDRRCTLAAQGHADWMAANRLVGHDEVEGTPAYDGCTLGRRLDRRGYVFGAVAENVAAGQVGPNGFLQAVERSLPHVTTLCRPELWHVGFGVARDEAGHAYWCAVYAAPRGHGHALVSLPPPLVEG